MPRRDEESGRQEAGQRWRLFDARQDAALHEVIHLSFSLRLLCLAVPLDRDQQIRLINLLTESGISNPDNVKGLDSHLKAY